VERTLHLASRSVRTGYVEAVATSPAHQGLGYGTQVMAEVGEIIRAGYELGGLGTGAHHFYERLGWLTWRGPTSVLTGGRSVRTAEDDGAIMVLPTPTSPPLDLDGPLACEWREGDVW
jgi:aminoglycoside 2'-N-acetyltransferase I